MSGQGEKATLKVTIAGVKVAANPRTGTILWCEDWQALATAERAGGLRGIVRKVHRGPNTWGHVDYVLGIGTIHIDDDRPSPDLDAFRTGAPDHA